MITLLLQVAILSALTWAGGLPAPVEQGLQRIGLSVDHFAPTQTAASVQPIKVPATASTNQPGISAAGYLALDDASLAPLAAREADKPLPIASITKMATALVILARHNPNETVTIPALPAYGPEDEVVGLKPGQTYSIEELLSALLINSGNDAADALAIIDAGSQQAFVARMNETMAHWGIANAHFSNPSGLSDTDNYASPRALAQMGQLLLHNATARKLVAMQTDSITAGDGTVLQLKTTNALLQTGQFSGIKTGYTVAAGQCFIGLTAVSGHPVITVVLGSVDRFGDTTTLRNWIAENYQWPNSR